MAFAEPWQVTQERRKRAAEMFPALGDTDAGTQLQIDNWVSAGNGTPAPVSNFTQLATALGRHAAELSAPEPDVPDVAPNVAGWEPQAMGAGASSMDEYQQGLADLERARRGESLGNAPELTDPLAKRYLAPGLEGRLSLLDVGGVGRGTVLSLLQGQHPAERSLTEDVTAIRGIDVPGVRSLPDSGLSFDLPSQIPLVGGANINLTPKTVGGFVLENLADPTTWIGAGGANAIKGELDDAAIAAGIKARQAARRSATWMEAADNALAEASGATEAVIRRQAPEAFQAGRGVLADTGVGAADDLHNAERARGRYRLLTDGTYAYEGPSSAFGWKYGETRADDLMSIESVDNYLRSRVGSERVAALSEAERRRLAGDIFDAERVRPGTPIAGADEARIGGGADLTPEDFLRRVKNGEQLTPEERAQAMDAFGRSIGATTAEEQAVAREALYNGPVPTDMREVDTGLIEGVRQRIGAPTGSSVEDALRAAREGEPPRIGGGADVPGEPPMARAGNAGDDAVQALRDALDAEVALRKSGQIASEISAGRSRQAGRIASGLEGMRGASLEDRIRAASGAARGQLRETFQQPLELTQEHVTALADRLQDALGGNQFEQLNGLRALNALVNGENVQPAQLKLLQRVYGDDIAGLAQRATIGRRAWKAGIDEAAGTRVERAARFGEKQIARYEEQALAQFKLADDLTEQLNLDPTNPQLKDAAAKARQAGEMAQMRADDLLARRTAALGSDPVDALESLARQRQASEGVKALRDAELAQRAGKELTPEQDALIRARDIVGRKLAISSPKAKEVMNAVDALQKGDRAILDAIKNDRPFYRGMQAWLTGDIADSFLSAALQRRALASTVLERQGVQPEIAHKMASTLFDAELQRHYNGNVPESAKRMLQDAMRAGAQDADLMPRGLELLVQRAKNTMFGLGDFGVLGVQGLNALRRGSIPLLTGTINRGLAALHLPHVSTVVDDVDRMTQYAIDGLHLGTGPSMARPDAGTLFSYLGKPGRTLDERVLNRAGNAMNEVQFGKILGTMRNLDHEGNLVMLKLLGRDISNPTVRAQAAQNANTLTSFARTALSGNRRAIETIGLTSPSMTRARINSIKEMANLINPKASTEQRIMAASMLLSTYVIYAGVAKALNDAIGTGDVELTPGKKGFGVITSRFTNKEGQPLKIDVVPQDSVEQAFAQSLETLADPNVDDTEIQRAWERVMLGSGSIVTRGVAAGAFRTGFEPGKGYRYGNLSGRGMLQSVLPVPPSAQSLAEGATTPLEIGLTGAGISNYPDAGSGGGGSRPSRARPSRPQRPSRSVR